MPETDGMPTDLPMSTEIQKLGSRLWHVAQTSKTKIVLVTSALRGEGKSTTVAYLASAMATNPGRRVLAIDTDFRNPSLNRHFKADVAKGLEDVLNGICPVTEALTPSGVRLDGVGLDLLLPRQDDVDPSLLLNTPKLLEIFRTVRGIYDFILVDSPALIPVADASTILPFCDGTILVVMAGTSTKHHLRRARELCLGMGANIIGLVVGNVQQAAPEYMDVNYYAYSGSRTRKTD